MSGYWREYWKKWRGIGASGPPRPRWRETLWASAGAAFAVGLLSLLSAIFFAPRSLPFLIAPFGASAMLVFGAPRSPLAQPRNLVGGHILSATVGVACSHFFGAYPVVSQLAAVSLALALMQVARAYHPPGGATALLPTLGMADIDRLGFSYVFSPVALGALLLLICALFFNNLARDRRYPEYWW